MIEDDFTRRSWKNSKVSFFSFVNLNAQRLDGRLAISSQPAEVSNYVRFLIGEEWAKEAKTTEDE
jgi:hypothetical protein